MSIPEFDVALEVSKLRSTPAIFAIPAIGQGENSKNSRNSSPSPSNGRGKAIPFPTGPAPIGTGLDWVVCPPEYDAEKYGGQWAAFDLADVCHLYGVRVVHAGERVLTFYPPTLEPELVAHASELLAEARPYLATHLDKLPIMEPAEAVKIIKDVMRKHPGLHFCRGEGGSMWPIYPRQWAAGQRATAQGLWFAAGETLDLYDFREVDV